MQLLIHAANLLFLASYLVRDILKLRVLSLVAGFFLLAFYCLDKEIVWAAIGWNVVFSAINGYQIRRLLLERRPVRLRDEEHKLRELAFRALSPREFQKLLRVGTFCDARPETRIVVPGVDLDALMVIVSGRVEVRAGDGKVASLGDGQFVGEMSFLTGKPPAVEVVAAEATRYVRLAVKELRQLLQADAELRAAIQTILGADLATKLRRVSAG